MKERFKCIHQFPSGGTSSDNGNPFQAVNWKELISSLGSRASNTIAYHPEQNGLVERANRTIKEILKSIVLEQQLGSSEDIMNMCPRSELNECESLCIEFAAFCVRRCWILHSLCIELASFCVRRFRILHSLCIQLAAFRACRKVSIFSRPTCYSPYYFRLV